MEHQPIQETLANEPSQSPLNQALPPMNQAPTANAASGRFDESYFDLFPPGYWFRPHDDELIVHYLQKKVNQEPLPPNKIHEVKLYQYNPETLAERYKLRSREKEWYFFTPRDRKYRNGQRPNRAAGDGYWKATGADKAITFNGAKVGSKKALVFYKGKPPKGDKTQWIMHEFRVENPPKCQRFGDDDMKLDDWVLCKIYKKANKPTKNPPRDDQEGQSEQDDGEVAPAENPTLAPEESPVPNEPTEMDNGYNDNGEPMVFNPYNLITYNPHLQEGFVGNPQHLGLPFDHHHHQVMPDLYYGYANNPTQIQNAPLAQYPIRSLESNIRPTMLLNQYPPNFSYKPKGDEEELKFAVSKFDHCDFSFQSDYSYEQLVDGIGNGLPDDTVMMLPNPDVGNLEF